MPCWPDLWENFKQALDVLGVVALPLGYIAIVVLLLWAPRVKNRWIRGACRMLGMAGVLTLVVALPAIILGIALGMGNPPMQSRIIQSADGQEAKLNYQAGFLGRDYTVVTLKRADCCRHTTVFWHAGPSWFSDTKVDWLDNNHLRLIYHSRPDDPQHCEAQVESVTITCIAKPLSEAPSPFQTPTSDSAKP